MWPFKRSQPKTQPSMGFVPPLPPVPAPTPPRGFRFASDPPSMDDLVHTDNDHPYRRARTGESISLLSGPVSREVTAVVTVVGWMKSSDPRARVVAGPRDLAGIYTQHADGSHQWLYANRVFRQVDGVLTHW